MSGRVGVFAGGAAALVFLACGGAEAVEEGRDGAAQEATALYRKFQALVTSGKPEVARALMERSARRRDLSSSAATFRSLASVAGLLEEHRAFVRQGAASLVGKNAALKTRRGSRRGRVEIVGEAGIVLVVTYSINREKREKRLLVRWAELAPEQEDQFAPSWRPEDTEGALARALVALGRRDKKAALDLVRGAGDHPFAVYLRGKLAPSRPREKPKGSARPGVPERLKPSLFGYRTGEARRRAALAFGGSERSEAAVDRALAWLARNQEPDGSWAIGKWEGSMSEDCSVGLTGLSLLAFLGAGHTEKTGQYRQNVQKAVSYLIGKQTGNGAIGTNNAHPTGGGYNHAIAGLALAEAYGMARVGRTRAAAQKAVTYSTDVHQSNLGGWRYKPKMSGDTSVTAWFVMQLKAAMMARLKVAPGGFQGASNWLRKVTEMPDRKTGARGGKARYQPGKSPTVIMTAAAMLCRQYMGYKRNDPLLQGGADYLLTSTPTWNGGPSWMFYYWYYGTLVMFQMGGGHWDAWNASMRDTLISHQIIDPGNTARDGSWDPIRDGERPGRAYSTAMCCLCLEVYYRYLPICR